MVQPRCSQGASIGEPGELEGGDRAPATRRQAQCQQLRATFRIVAFGADQRSNLVRKKIIRSQLPSNSFTDAAAKPFPVGAAYAVPYGVSEHSQIQCLLCDKGLASAVPC
jgi:hypothetical protein